MEHNPYPSAVEEQEELQQQMLQQALAVDAARDWCWLATGPRGRRILRHILREAGIDIMAASVGSTFNPNFGQMCFAEGARARGLNLLAVLTKALVTGDLKLEHWQLLFTEKQDV